MNRVLLARVPLAKVAFATVVAYAITATVEMTLPAHLSTTQVSWLVKPWLGAYVHTFALSSLPYAALEVGLSGLALIVVAFYLDHCVIDQPWWAVLGGWAPLLAGLTLASWQTAFGGWWVSIDIDHSGFPLGYCEFVIGAAVVGISWLLAPELFNPRLGRPWIAAIIAAVVAVELAQSALNASPTVGILVVLLVLITGLTAGTRTAPAAESIATHHPEI